MFGATAFRVFVGVRYCPLHSHYSDYLQDDCCRTSAEGVKRCARLVIIEMRFISRPALLPSCLVFIATLSARVSRVEASCIRLTGIESGGGEGLLDLDKLIGTLETNSFSVGSGALAIGSCSTALETPVAMRHLLGELRAASRGRILKNFGPCTVQFTAVQCGRVQQYGMRLKDGIKYSWVSKS